MPQIDRHETNHNRFGLGYQVFDERYEYLRNLHNDYALFSRGQ